ncbi:hypothetical protein [Enterovibrio norvegicus]|nr:hypothetical protein [Enterovibrio norvegicus]
MIASERYENGGERILGVQLSLRNVVPCSGVSSASGTTVMGTEVDA